MVSRTRRSSEGATRPRTTRYDDEVSPLHEMTSLTPNRRHIAAQSNGPSPINPAMTAGRKAIKAALRSPGLSAEAMETCTERLRGVSYARSSSQKRKRGERPRQTLSINLTAKVGRFKVGGGVGRGAVVGAWQACLVICARKDECERLFTGEIQRLERTLNRVDVEELVGGRRRLPWRGVSVGNGPAFPPRIQVLIVAGNYAS